ncbi:MAG: DUF1854 domain-containing protein [Oscillospiraceae bacterium]|jgi:hypothetical protein|nr:DUF1854 domain-containing protein [Oscillospiraceae bacterium]
METTKISSDTESAAPMIALIDAIDMGNMEPEKAEIFQTSGGFTKMKYNDKEYKRITLRRSMPTTNPSMFISVADHENKEICVIRSLDELNTEQLRIVSDELDKRYYCPNVIEIKSVKDKMGYVYIELILIGHGEKFEKNCAVKDVNKNIRLIDDNRLIIIDVDGNRYLVESLNDLDKKSVKRLEPYLF